MKTTYTEEELQTAIDAAFPEGARADDCNLDSSPGQIAWELEAPNRLAIAKAFLEKLDHPEPKTSTFEAHGKTWTRHVPGDAMPCDGDAMVEALMRFELNGAYEDSDHLAERWDWSNSLSGGDIIGWRYADEPMLTKPISSTSWTPAVGDVVQLKSGGPKMTVTGIESTVWCAWFYDNKLQHLDTTLACLTPVTE
jgi:hypothetical protein